MSQRVFFLIAFLSIAGGVLGLSGFFQSKNTTASNISNISIQVAQLKSPVVKGDIVTGDNIRYFRLREAEALEYGIVSDVVISPVSGMVAKKDLSTADYLSMSDFILPSDPAYLDTVIDDHMTPYSLTIERKDFIGSGISVGDRVDVIILTSDEQNIGDTSRSNHIESFRSLSVSPLLRNVRVLAIDDGKEKENEKEDILPLTIELDRDQVAKMVIARRIGIIEVIKSSNASQQRLLGMKADTHDVLPNFKSVTEIRGSDKAFN